MHHSGAGAVRQHIARSRLGWRLKKARDALRIIDSYCDRLWIRGTHQRKVELG